MHSFLTHLMLVMMVAASSITCSYSISCNSSAPEVSLSELQGPCTSDQQSRSPDCVAAMHRFCSRVKFSSPIATLGVSRENAPNRIGVSCVQSHWNGDVSISELQKYNKPCALSKSQSRDCIAAIHRYCKAKFGSNDFAGLSQEVGDGVLGVHCFKSPKKEDVRNDALTQLQNLCKTPNSDSDRCFSAASRWCVQEGFSGGITQEKNQDTMTVACYNAEFSADVFVEKNEDFYTSQKTIEKICDLTFEIDQGEILNTSPWLIGSTMYNNLDRITQQAMCPYQKDVFIASREVTETSSFTVTNKVTIEESVTVSESIPFFDGEKISLSVAVENDISLTKTHTKTVTFEKKSTVDIPPCHSIVVEAIVTEANMNVPWNAIGVNQLGSLQTLKGIWQGVNYYNLTVVQKDNK